MRKVHLEFDQFIGYLACHIKRNEKKPQKKLEILIDPSTSGKALNNLQTPSSNGVEDSGDISPSIRMEGTSHKQGMKSGSATGVGSPSSGMGPLATGGGPVSASASRSVSLASVSSDGSSESHLVEQEDIVALTQEVRAFKEALGKLRRLFHPDKEKCESLRVAAHERLGEVLRILRIILERYPALQSTELLVAAGSLIHQVKEHHYEDEKNDVKEFMESIDQLALAFSSRVSEYLMGDLDSNISLASSISSKTKSCENLPSDVESTNECRDGKDSDFLSGSQMDAILIQLEQGVEVALHRAKLWSKYAKDIMSYVEKRCNLEMEFAKNVTKLAQTVRSALKEECYLPFQSIYITAMDREIDNCNSAQTTCSLLTSHKFLEPLSARRNEHERCRKQLKEIWHRELKRMQEAVSNLRKAKSLYIQRQQEWERAKDAAIRAENAAEVTEQAKIDKRKKLEDDALQKAMEAETTYKACVSEANERHGQLLRVKGQVLQQVRELMLQCDQTMKAVTVSYFQLQHSVSAPAPVQFQTLCESSRLYEPGSQYMEFIRRMPMPNRPNKDGTSSANSTIPNLQGHPEPFSFEPYSEESASVAMLEKERKSNGSLSADSSESAGKERVITGPQSMPIKAWGTSVSPHGGMGNASAQVNSDTESVESSPSAKSRDTSPTASPMMPARRLVPASSGDELENEQEQETDGSYLGYTTARRHLMSKAAVSHTFRKLKTPSRCRECDSYVYFQGAECIECGLACHKKCLESLAIQCGHKRLPRKMTTFGVDLSQHLVESGAHVPHLLAKCISEIDARGIQIKGLYRVSGVKSKVEKLCQAFENGADLVDLTDIHPNVIANVLKLYLRQLPEPLLTSRLYPEFIRVAKESPANTVEELRDLCHKLPRHHYSTLAYLMHHLKRVSLEAESNNMPPSNLGIVFGPTLLRTSEGSASLSSLVDTVHQTKVIELLIIHTDEIFGPVENIQNSKEIRTHVTKGEDSSILSKVPVVRSISFLEKHRKSRDSETIVSTPADRRGEIREEVILPGFVVEHKPLSLDIDPLASEEGLLSPTSDDDLPDFLLPDDSSKTRKLPYFRPGSAPKVFKGSLKDYHGLEGVDLNSLSSQDNESHSHLRVKKSFSDLPVHGTAVSLHPNYSTVLSDSTLPSLSSISGGDGSMNSSITQSTSSQVKMITISNAPFMDSSIDSDHSWESHSTGSSGRGTQHSDQGSLGSAQKGHLLSINNDRDETDGRLDSLFTSMSSVARNDENRVKIQVPSAVPIAPMTTKDVWNTSSSSTPITSSKTAESHGVVTVLEGPSGSTTLVDSLNKTISDQSKSVLVGGGRGHVAPSAGTNITGSVLVSELASIPTGLTHEFAHVFRSVKSVTTTTTTVDSNSRKIGERFPRFV